MEDILVRPLCSFAEFRTNLGSYYQTVDRMVEVDHDVRIIDETTNKPLCILRKRVIPSDIWEPVVSNYLPIMKKMSSANRGFAAGMKERVQTAKFERSQPVHSTIAGYIDSPNNKYPCRLTKFSKTHFKEYQTGIPFIKAIDACFQETLPGPYAAQRGYAEKTKYRIEDTIFTTMTVNYNFQTALHVDKGDCKEGFGTLVVCSENVQGGHLLFPRYNLGIVVNTGDILFMDVHEYHCNSLLDTSVPNSYRVSFVCYLRTRLLDCLHNELLQELGIEEGKHWETETLIQRILQKLGTPPPERVYSIEQPKDWVVETDTFCWTCKNRQYNFYDKVRKKKVLSLHNLWSYLKITPDF